MPNYQLNADISAADLATIHAAGQSIVLLKLTGSGTPLSWVAFTPMEGNSVQWVESYALYASTSEVTSGTTITMMSQTAASPQQNYPLTAAGAFGPPVQDTTIGVDTYESVNNFAAFPLMSFGLAQGVQVNGTAFPYQPINAQAVPLNQTVTFAPLTEVVIFLETNITSGMVITEVLSNSTTLTFGNGINDITVAYESGTFVQTGSSVIAAKKARAA